MIFEGDDSLFRFVIAGCFQQDYILPVSGPPQINVLGGNLAYAAVGLKLWGERAGLLARVGEDYPAGWLSEMRHLGFDLQGVKVLPGAMDTRRFMVHEDLAVTHYDNPVQHFSDRSLTYPPGLLGYRPMTANVSSRTTPLKQSLQISDIPEAYFDATTVHICPVDYLSHVILPSVFKQKGATMISLAPAPGYMVPSFWEEIPGLLSDITAFITPEPELRQLFQGRSTDLWEMVEVLSGFGPELIIIYHKLDGCYLYDGSARRRMIVPNYQSQVVDPTGVSDAFAGAFVAGYRQFYDPLEAVLMGSVAVSLMLEGSGVFYPLDVMPGLVEARKLALKDLVREI